MADVTALTFLALCLPLASALAAPFVIRMLGANGAWLLAIAPLLAFLHFLRFVPQIARGRSSPAGMPGYRAIISPSPGSSTACRWLSRC